MKLRITILAILAFFALDQVSLAEEVNQGSDQVGMTQGAMRPLHRHAHYRSYNWYPMACESVIFPRSPLCGGRAPLPWDWECPWWGC
jgi:hypothetical protein